MNDRESDPMKRGHQAQFMSLEQIDQHGDLVAYRRGSDLKGAKTMKEHPHLRLI